jgi:hypothetical protein
MVYVLMIIFRILYQRLAIVLEYAIIGLLNLNRLYGANKEPSDGHGR